MIYTTQQLETQRSVAQLALDNEQKTLAWAQSPDYPPAKTYGENVRANHVRTITMRIACYTERVAHLSKCIAAQA